MKTNKNWCLLWNPFIRIAGWQAFGMGVCLGLTVNFVVGAIYSIINLIVGETEDFWTLIISAVLAVLCIIGFQQMDKNYRLQKYSREQKDLEKKQPVSSDEKINNS